MKSIAIRIGIDTPISLEKLLHLDGLLCSLTAKAGRQWNKIPLQQSNGFWHGSAAILECSPFGPAYEKVSRLKHIRVSEIAPQVASALPKNQRRIGDMADERNQLNSHSLLGNIRGVWFTARGQEDAILELLSTATNLGSMGQTGYGHITELMSIQIPDIETTGLLLDKNTPARTLPIADWKRLSSSNKPRGTISLQRPIPPYWSGPKIECISPMQIDLIGTRTEIEDLVQADAYA